MNELDQNVPSRTVLWFAAVSISLFTAGMYAFFDSAGWKPVTVSFEVVSGLVSLALFIILVNKAKFGWILRIFTFAIFAVYFWYVIDECYIEHQAFRIGGLGSASPFNAIRGFLFFGIPCLLYTLWGSVWGKVGRNESRDITRSDIFVFHLARVARWGFLALTLLAVIGALARS